MIDEQNKQRERVLEEKKNVSSRISDLCRYIGFGLVAVVFTILSSDSELVIGIYENYTGWLLSASVLGTLTIILDYLQFLSGYRVVQKALCNKKGNYMYDDTSFWYWLRNFAFMAKQITAFSGAIILVIVIGLSAIPR